MRRVVGVDLETTSLEAREGEIIEVACIAYNWDTKEEISRLVRLCKPKTLISEHTTTLTGITNDMVANAPLFEEIRDTVADFIGDDFIFAHNASFDVGWLREHGVPLKSNEVWDTFPLASIALPEAPSYNLGQLKQYFEIDFRGDGEHRAGEDVEVTWNVFLRLLPLLKIGEEWKQEWLGVLRAGKIEHYAELFEIEPTRRTPPPTSQQRPPLTKGGVKASVSDLFSEDGLLAQKIDNWKVRDSQQVMAGLVEKNISEGDVGYIEAATGTGKTYAYLLPLIRKSYESDVPVIVSTYTKNLQDQLITKDIPKILVALGLERNIAVLKGRSNYLCWDRFCDVIESESHSPGDALTLIKLLAWLSDGGDGDLTRLNFSHQGERLLGRISANSIQCRAVCSKNKQSRCWYQRARATAAQADVLIVNHALLAAWASAIGEKAGGGGAPFSLSTDIVFDEAHHLIEVTRDASTIRHSVDVIDRLLSSIAKLRNGDTARLRTLATRYREWIAELNNLMPADMNERRLLLSTQLESLSGWDLAVQKGSALHSEMHQYYMTLRTDEDDELAHDMARELGTYLRSLESFLTPNPDERVTWTEKDQKGVVTGFDAPLAVSDQMRKLFSIVHSSTLTSATLSLDQSFDYWNSNLGIDASGTILETPFDYEKQMLVYFITDGPLPNNHSYFGFVSELIESVSTLLNGRTLVLFTSHDGVKKSFDLINNSLYEANIKLFAQRMTGGKFNITQRFTQDHNSVLLGTSSFWEGFDVPGESLSAVIIPKLPFPEAGHPVLQALSLKSDKEGHSSFRDVVLPRMLLQLRQGMGRLIRDEDDFGVVIIADPRVQSKPYGEAVRNSLPAATAQTGSLKNLRASLRRWFGKERLESWE